MQILYFTCTAPLTTSSSWGDKFSGETLRSSCATISAESAGAFGKSLSSNPNFARTTGSLRDTCCKIDYIVSDNETHSYHSCLGVKTMNFRIKDEFVK